MLKEIGGEAEISEPLRIFCKNSQMMNSCHILWRTGKGEVGCLSLRAGGRSLWGSVGPPVQHQLLQKHWSENQTPGREQGRSSCQHGFVKLVLFPYVTGWQISLTEANACLVTVSPAERSQASAASVWSRQISTWGSQNRLENITRRVPQIISLSKWKFWSRRAQREAAVALWLLSVFGSKGNSADDGLENEPVTSTDSSKGWPPSVMLGAGFRWLDIFEMQLPKKKKKKKCAIIQRNVQSTNDKCQRGTRSAKKEICKSKNLETVVDQRLTRSLLCHAVMKKITLIFLHVHKNM